jgi:hypothetical protein
MREPTQVDAALPVDLPDDTPLLTAEGMTTLGEVLKGRRKAEPTDAEVEAVAEAAYTAHVNRNKPWAIESLFQKQRWRSSARAAINALDEVRGK